MPESDIECRVAREGVRTCASGRGMCGLSSVSRGPSIAVGFEIPDVPSKTLFINPDVLPLFGVGAMIPVGLPACDVEGVTNAWDGKAEDGREGVAVITMPRLPIPVAFEEVRMDKGEPAIVTCT